MQEPSTSMVQETTKCNIEAGQWLCETALWTVWTHVGTVEAMTMCEMLVITVEKVTSAFTRHQVIRILAAEYCRSFLARLVTACPPVSDWPSDISVPFTDWGEIVLSMMREARIIVGLTALDAARTARRGRFLWGSKAVQRLEDELYTGQSAIILSGPESLERVVGVSALQLEDDEDRVLAQVGVWDAELGTIQAKCCLPGTKLQEMETPAEALKNRVIGEELASLNECIIVTRATKEVERVVSEQYRVPTKYLRTKYEARWIAGSFDLKETGVVFWEEEPLFLPSQGDNPQRAISAFKQSTQTPASGEREQSFMGRRATDRRPSQESRGPLSMSEVPTHYPRPSSLFVLVNDDYKPRVYAWLDDRLFRTWSSVNGKANLESFLMSKTIREEHLHAAKTLYLTSKASLISKSSAVGHSASDGSATSDLMPLGSMTQEDRQPSLLPTGISTQSSGLSERLNGEPSVHFHIQGEGSEVHSVPSTTQPTRKPSDILDPDESYVSLHV
mmetsp:Transcript_51887/g.123488  ORF Transcript_51887/g.123488 Transcript_51887/m.123488 type:complete len:504 (+) Transcript_51887:1-1512(+)